MIEGLKDGKVRMTCSTWEDARVLAPGETLGLRREGTFRVVSRITRVTRNGITRIAAHRHP